MKESQSCLAVSLPRNIAITSSLPNTYLEEIARTKIGCTIAARAWNFQKFLGRHSLFIALRLRGFHLQAHLLVPNPTQAFCSNFRKECAMEWVAELAACLSINHSLFDDALESE